MEGHIVVINPDITERIDESLEPLLVADVIYYVRRREHTLAKVFK